MALSVNSLSGALVLIKGLPADFVTGSISENAIGHANDKLAIYGGTASDAFKALLAKYRDRLVPIGGYRLMVRNETESTFPVTILNMPANQPFTDANTHNQFRYIAQAIANKPKFSNYLYFIFLNLGA